MRDFDHPNIVRLIGIALDKEDMPLVVLPFMKHGDLLTYIRDEANVSTLQLRYLGDLCKATVCYQLLYKYDTFKIVFKISYFAESYS